MKWGKYTVPLVIAVLALSCVDNEISFYIEHAKSQPEAPACTWSPSDDFASTGVMDLAFSNMYVQGFLVRNQLMARDDLANLKAETNGIFVDAYDISLRLAPNEAIGTTESIDLGMYIEPESTEVLVATIMSPTLVDELASRVGCLPLSSDNYPAEQVYSNGTDASGEAVGRMVGTAYSSVRFLGHTNGGLDVSTPEFIFGIELCCGCLVDWADCADYCERYCSAPQANKMCVKGVANGENLADCREIYNNPSAEWEDDCEEDVGDGATEPRLCNCNDCGGV